MQTDAAKFALVNGQRVLTGNGWDLIADRNERMETFTTAYFEIIFYLSDLEIVLSGLHLHESRPLTRAMPCPYEAIGIQPRFVENERHFDVGL